jgi:membrane protein DedA with SNARE-associated domain
VTGQLTAWIAHHGVYAVFALMALDAVAPAGGELIMLFAGAVAAGAIAGAQVGFLGGTLAAGLESYLALAAAGSLGYLAGSLVGWGVGRVGGRALIERRGRWLHVSPQALARSERWFQRHGPAAVFLGRLTPVVRSFISIPAGALGAPLLPYTVLTLLGSAIWCFAFAGAGWALGGSWESFHHGFRYADYAAVAVAVVAVGAVVVHRLRGRRAAPSE